MSHVKERPILFSAPMVRAILAGTKTQTRRLLKHQHATDALHAEALRVGVRAAIDAMPRELRCPYGAPGDRLWVRETWAGADEMAGLGSDKDVPQVVAYRADKTARIFPDPPAAADTYGWNWDALRWRPSIHMPRWASRITLEVTSVRVERLQEISEDDARAEGVERKPYHRAAFGDLWDQINGKRAPWASNPWVWVVAFKLLASTRTGGSVP